MIDLTKKGLPNVVTINGSPYSIYTDFRLWMRFENEVSRLKKQGIDIPTIREITTSNKLKVNNLKKKRASSK